ncbi:acetylglutamate/acetylaminoadipate kinase [Halorubrum sp. HHNYT27]|uniref:acetylglutamate/acetylaminoadipate kinase n=1 Tax=Halorubrum sp. HHNYT27 TaxID=3402275 RepID=UPI003EBD703A
MTVVVKIGGARTVDPAGALADIAVLREGGRNVAVVHGGSTAMDETLERMGMEPEYVETPDGVIGRFTDEETMLVFKMVFGQLNTDLVTGLQNEGVNAVGLNGADARLLTGPRKDAIRVVEDGKKKIRRGDHSGTIETVNSEFLELLFENGYTPVASPPMLADDIGDSQSADSKTESRRWTAVNTDADRASASVAGELGATLVSLTDVPGIFKNPDDPATVIECVETPEALEEVERVATGFMRRKVMAAREALVRGAEAVVVADANTDEPIRSALSGDGTTITRDAVVTEP